MANIAIIGEVMLEFSPLSGKSFVLGISGDTYNSACTLTGLDISTTYVTSLGVGQSADLIRKDAQQRQIHLLEPKEIKDKSPGLYMINNDITGERYFDYWRSDSAAKALLCDENLLLPLLKQVENHNYIYLTGITLALMSEPCRAKLYQYLIDYKDRGGKVIFDPNYRPILWLDKATAIKTIQEMQSYVDVYLPGFEEEESLFGSTTTNDAVGRLLTITAEEVVIKNGSQHCLLITQGQDERIEIIPSTDVVDTTGAGDTFNGAYIGARLTGLTPKDAIDFAAEAASQVLSVKGGVLQSTQLSVLRESLNKKMSMTQ